jgi:hypothetical protein
MIFKLSKLEVVLGHVQTLADLCWYVGGGLLCYIPLCCRVIYKYNFAGSDPLVINCVSLCYTSYKI